MLQTESKKSMRPDTIGWQRWSSRNWARNWNLSILANVNHYYLEYSDYWPHVYCYNHNVSADMSSVFFGCFLSNMGVHTESRTIPIVNYDRVQVSSYSKHSLLVLPVTGIELATCRWFHPEAPSNQTPYPLHHMSLKDNLF